MSRSLIASTTLLALALSSCTTVSIAESPINARWVGHSAGEFFAKYNPPLSDTDSGSSTVYNWRGAYSRIKTKEGRSVSLSCSAKITVSENYTIRDISVIGDRPGASGKSYCEEVLTVK